MKEFDNARILLFLLKMAISFVLLLIAMPCRTEGSTHLFVTGTVMEIDRCASAWLIKRFVDTKAEFVFLEDDALLTSKGIAFDTPVAELRRTHQISTFESIIRKYDIEDERVNQLARMIHAIEINFWNKNGKPQALKFKQELQTILDSAPDNESALTGCFTYFDAMTPISTGTRSNKQ